MAIRRSDASTKRTAGGRRRNFKVGDRVRQSGIYEVVHNGGHRANHVAVMISGDHFPGCAQCQADVGFKLLRTVSYIFYDEDFSKTK